jgi:hypothetical protein
MEKVAGDTLICCNSLLSRNKGFKSCGTSGMVAVFGVGRSSFYKGIEDFKCQISACLVAVF